MDSSLADRIKLARKKAGLTQVNLAGKLGIAYPTLNKYERGHRIPDASLLNRMANVLGCSPGWLLSGKDTDAGAQPVPDMAALSRVPVLDRISDDFPESVHEETTEYISLPDLPDGSYSLIVKGDSMSPAIRENDYVVFKPAVEPETGDILVVKNEWGESILRRYRIKNSAPWLVSDNPEYPAVRYDGNYKMLGKVIAVWRKITF